MPDAALQQLRPGHAAILAIFSTLGEPIPVRPRGSRKPDGRIAFGYREREARAVNAAEEIDALIANNVDWRGGMLAHLRATILATDPAIIETWKWMGSPVWELGGIICVGNIHKNKAKLTFMDGAALADPDHLFNAELEGNKRRAIDFFEGDQTRPESLQALIRSAVAHIQERAKS